MHKTTLKHTGKYSTALALAIIAGLLAATGALAAGAGSLDLTFGANGVAVTDLGSSTDTGDGVVLQSDGKILVNGFAQLDMQNSFHRSPVIVRYNSSGAVDTTFGTNGRIIAETGNFSGSRMALQSNGKLVVCGSLRNDVGVARYNSNGTLDTFFGTNGIGIVHLSDDSRETCSDVAVQGDGKIVIAGSEEIGNYVFYFIARFNSNGTPDMAFNDRGFQIVDFPNSRFNYGQAVTVQGNGKIVMAGTMETDYDPGEGPWLTLAGFNADGSLDSTFGTGGTVTIQSLNFRTYKGALALQSDGKILVGGTRVGDPRNDTIHDLAVARFNTNGSLDTSFGGTGVVINDFGNDEDGHDVVVQQDGNIVVVGRQYNSTMGAFLLARYNSNGALDTSFGTNGQVISDFGGTGQSANGAALQSDGKILAAGSSNGNVALARYNPTESNIQFVTNTFRSVGASDGWILESTETSNMGGTFDRLATTFNVGDNPKDRQFRGVLSFNTAPLPDTAIVTGVQLNIKRQNVVGTDPFTTHGKLLLVIRRGSFSGNLSLQASDFSSGGSLGATRDPFVPVTFSWYRATLSNTNLSFINRYGPTQFRLQFTKDDNDDMSADYMKFFSGNSDLANQPQLLVTYFIP